MSRDSEARETVEQWLTKVAVSPYQTVWRGLDEYIPTDPALEDKCDLIHWKRFSVPDQVTGEAVLTEKVLISMLRGSGSLPYSQLGREAGKIMYQSLAYLSQIPFPPATANFGKPSLTYHELRRSLCWLQRGHIVGQNDDRVRSTHDDRRHLFQSLATALDTAGPHPSDEQERQPATGDAHSPSNPDLTLDEDGDQMFHDLVDVLYAIQPCQSPPVERMPRQFFVTSARTMHNKQLCLRRLGIPRKRLKTLIQVLLPLQLHEDVWKTDEGALLKIEEFGAAAERILAGLLAGCVPPAAQVVSWHTFNKGIPEIVPHLFRVYYRVLNQVLLGKLLEHQRDEPRPNRSFILPEAALDWPVLCQVGTIFSHTFSFDDWSHTSGDMFCGKRKYTFERLFRRGLGHCGMLVVTGVCPESRVLWTIAIFVHDPDKDQEAIMQPADDRSERTSLVILKPVQRIFRGIVGKPAWTEGRDEISFLNYADGASLVLRDGRRIAAEFEIAGDQRKGVSRQSNSAPVHRFTIKNSYMEFWKQVSRYGPGCR